MRRALCRLHLMAETSRDVTLARFRPASRLLAAGQWLLGRLAALDTSEASRSRGASRIRRGLAVLFACYGIVLALRTVQEGNVPSVGQVFMMMIASVLLVNRIGRFLRDWTLVVLGFFAYILAGNFAQQLTLSVHYKPQIRIDQLLGFGTVPTVWLQHHLYHDTTGPLELFSLAMYVSHFLLPIVLAFGLWWSGRRAAFQELMFGLLAVSVLSEITFILAPTAPPWLAAKHGMLSPVHDIIRQALFDVHLDGLGRILGDSSYYNIVAAFPSLHAAFPIVALLVLLKHRLPSWLIATQTAIVLAVSFSIVYSGEHYVADALAGAVYAWLAWLLVCRALAALPDWSPAMRVAAPAAASAFSHGSLEEPTV